MAVTKFEMAFAALCCLIVATVISVVVYFSYKHYKDQASDPIIKSNSTPADSPLPAIADASTLIAPADNPLPAIADASTLIAPADTPLPAIVPESLPPWDSVEEFAGIWQGESPLIISSDSKATLNGVLYHMAFNEEVDRIVLALPHQPVSWTGRISPNHSEIVLTNNNNNTNFVWTTPHRSVKGRYVTVLRRSGPLCMSIGDIQVFGQDGVTNIALGCIASISSEHPSNSPLVYLCDGDPNTVVNIGCSDAKEAWATIDLGFTNNISKIVVYNRQDCCWDQIVGSVIQVGNERMQVVFESDKFTNQLRSDVASDINVPNEYHILSWSVRPPFSDLSSQSGLLATYHNVGGEIVLKTPVAVKGRYVKLLRRSGPLCYSVGDIQIFGLDKTTNIALGAIASASSVYYYTPLNLTNDGYPSNPFHAGCDDAEAWIMVDLGTSADITNVTVYNREDCCWDRINGSVIQILSETNAVLFESQPFLSAQNSLVATDAQTTILHNTIFSVDALTGKIAYTRASTLPCQEISNIYGTYNGNWGTLDVNEIQGAWTTQRCNTSPITAYNNITASPTTADFTLYKGDFGGGDLGLIAPATSNLCQQNCITESQCTHYTYQPSTARCYLKTMDKSPESQSFYSGMKLSDGSIKQYVDRGQFPTGNNKINQPVTSVVNANACAALCQKDPDCSHFSHNSSTSECHLKTWVSDQTLSSAFRQKGQTFV